MQQGLACQEGLSNIEGQTKEVQKKKKALYVGWDESEPTKSENEEKNQEANLRLTNLNICFIANEDEVTIKHCLTLDEVEDAYVELVEDFKKLSK